MDFLHTVKLETFSDSACNTPCSVFNIDSTVYIKITFSDFNNNSSYVYTGISERTLYVDKGTFSGGTNYQYLNSEASQVVSYTCSKFGTITFQCFDKAITIKVKGWKNYKTRTATNGWECRVDYNETTARCIIKDPASVSFTTSTQDYTEMLTDTWIRPYMPTLKAVSIDRWMIARDNSAYIQKIASRSVSNTIYVQFSWTHRGIPE